MSQESQAFASKPNPLQGVVQVLDEAASVAKDVAPPIADFANVFGDALAIVDDLELFITGLNDLDKGVGEIGELLFLLTEIPPPVGEVLDVIGAALKNVSVIVGEALVPVNEFKVSVLDEARPVLKRISGVTNDVNSAVSGFANKVPQWTKTITVLNFGWSIVSVLVDLLDSTEPGKRLHSLMEKFQSIGSIAKTVFDDVAGGFKAVWKVMSEVMKPVCDVIHKFGDWLRPVLAAVKFVGDVFRDIRSILDEVLDAVKPIKWALDAVDCIFKEVVQPVLDWIMKELGIKALMDEFAKMLEGALHLSDVEEKLSGLLNKDKLNSADGSLTSSHSKTSKMKELNDALGEFVSSPQQALMAAILTAISGAPVLPGVFPPRLPDLPPLNIQRYKPSHIEPQGLAVMRAATLLEAAPRSMSPLPAIAAPQPVSSQTDWSDVDTFTTDIDNITVTLKPILAVGQELKKFLDKAHKQIGIPAELHDRLTQFSYLVNFLHNVSQFLQQFPLFTVFLPPLTTSLGKELQAITDLDSDMSQFAESVSSLSDSLKPIVAAESPTLTDAINKLTTTLGNWKSQALKYRNQLQHAYRIEKKKRLRGKFSTRIDALATTFHSRIAKLQGMLNQVKELAQKARDGGNALEKSLNSVTSQFDQVHPHVAHLTGHIQKVAHVSHYAAQLDAIFQALQWMLKEYKCIGDKHDIKANSLEPFKLLSSISEDPAIKEEFQQLYSKLLEEFFPVQDLDSIVKGGEKAVASATTTIKQTSPDYLEALSSLQKLQVGPHKYKYYRKATKFDIKDPNAFKCKYHDKPTKEAVVIDSHFFSDEEVQEALQLGRDMNA